MGGHGSTRWGRHRPARTVEMCAALPIGAVAPALTGAAPPTGTAVASLTRTSGAGLRAAWEVAWALEREGDGSATIVLSVEAAHHGRGTQGQVVVRIVTTSPRYGGVRHWWACPGCDRRCALLYLPPGEAWPACRTCYRLTYATRQAHDKREDRYRRMPPWERLALLGQMEPRALPDLDELASLDGPARMMAMARALAGSLDERLRLVHSLTAPWHSMGYWERRAGR